MIKLMIIIRRNPDLTPEQFRNHLAETHARLVKECTASKRYVRKYVQSYGLGNLDGSRTFDGAVELWFESTSDMDQFFADPEYLEVVRPDEARFADLKNCTFLITEEAQII